MADGDPALLVRLSAFFAEESAALDERRFDDWLGMLSDDFCYVVPVPQSREDVTLSPYAPELFLAHESKSFLAMRFERIRSDYAWAEHPAAFVRHFVSNVRVMTTDRNALVVSTNVMVTRARLPEPVTLSTAGRQDVIIDTEAGFRLQYRTVYLDAEVPTDSQLGVIY